SPEHSRGAAVPGALGRDAQATYNARMIRLTREQVREIDRRAIEEYGIPGIVLMENAARAVADAATEILRGARTPSVAVLCGGGNNGGDGFAAARHLYNRGIHVVVVPTRSAPYRGDALTNLGIVEAMRLEIASPEELETPLADGAVSLIIDGLFGTGLQSPPRDGHWIEMLNRFAIPVLAIDLPSGMNCDTGEPMGVCVKATRTVTFVAEKAGFANPASRQFTGEITIADIGCPRELIEEVAKMPPT
ncbi:MAG: NAD(P)H-hydrate epimerase, partial [Tepidisphaeraceae bacterium]